MNGLFAIISDVTLKKGVPQTKACGTSLSAYSQLNYFLRASSFVGCTMFTLSPRPVPDGVMS